MRLKCTVGHKSHEPFSNVFLMEAGVKTFVTHCTISYLFEWNLFARFMGIIRLFFKVSSHCESVAVVSYCVPNVFPKEGTLLRGLPGRLFNRVCSIFRLLGISRITALSTFSTSKLVRRTDAILQQSSVPWKIGGSSLYLAILTVPGTTNFQVCGLCFSWGHGNEHLVAFFWRFQDVGDHTVLSLVRKK